MRFCEKLQRLRKKAGLSQEQLAEQMNVTRQAISKWETGEGMPDVDNLLPLARLLHTTVDYLLDEDVQAPAAKTAQSDWWERVKAFARRFSQRSVKAAVKSTHLLRASFFVLLP